MVEKGKWEVYVEVVVLKKELVSVVFEIVLVVGMCGVLFVVGMVVGLSFFKVECICLLNGIELIYVNCSVVLVM